MKKISLTSLSKAIMFFLLLSSCSPSNNDEIANPNLNKYLPKSIQDINKKTIAEFIYSSDNKLKEILFVTVNSKYVFNYEGDKIVKIDSY